MVYIFTQWCLRPTSGKLGPFSLRVLTLDVLLIAGSIGVIVYYGMTLQAFSTWFLVLCTLVVSLTDFTCHVIPDRLTIPGIVTGLVIGALGNHMSMLDALIGGVVGFATFYSLALVGEKLHKKPALGGGDIKLAALLGVFLGWQLLLLTIALASIGGLTFALVRTSSDRYRIHDRIPFGPFLTCSALFSIFCGRYLVDAYMSFSPGWPL